MGGVLISGGLFALAVPFDPPVDKFAVLGIELFSGMAGFGK
jgi:hypothetical protein